MIRSFKFNNRVKWDPSFGTGSSRHTAQNGGDLMPSKSLREKLLDTAMDEYDHMEPDPVGHSVTSDSPKAEKFKKSALKPTYVNQGLDTSQLYVPLESPKQSENSKLILDNELLVIDESIPTYGRMGKKAYKDVNYSPEYHPPEFTNPRSKHVRFNDNVNPRDSPRDRGDENQGPRRSERLKQKARTRWRPTKIAQVMFGTMVNALLVSNCVYAEPAKPLQVIDNSTMVNQVKAIPLSKTDKDEKLRAYHARLDLLNDMFHPNEDLYGWQVEHIAKHLVRKNDDKVNIFFKVIWFGGDKQWMHMDDLRLHDPFLLV